MLHYREREYAAWTLVNGYTLNHVTISTHRLKSPLINIDNLNHFIEDSGFKLNSEGGVLKVSPDDLLLQSSTVTDSILFEFSDGVKDSVPCSYIEFAQRLVLPQYKHLPEDKPSETEYGSYDYTRGSNPTRNVLESFMAKLDKSDQAFCFSSGMAALFVVNHLVKHGKEVVAREGQPGAIGLS